MVSEAVLEVRDLSVTYQGSLLAVANASFAVPEGGAVALLGSNGAGKTTVIRAVCGLLSLHDGKLTGGTITWRGEDLTRLKGYQRASLGIGLAPEGRLLFGHLSVQENLLVGAANLPRRERRARMAEVLDLVPALRELSSRKEAGWLSGGEQQLVALGRALMARPTLLILDEASLGLSPIAQERFFAILATMRNEIGMSLLIVEQNAELALELCDSAFVLEAGRVVDADDAATMQREESVSEHYLGMGEEIVFRHPTVELPGLAVKG